VSVIGYRKHLPGDVGTMLTRGPSFSVPQRALSHAR
jgi:hypothetical protein